jgi:hypothetical protein
MPPQAARTADPPRARMADASIARSAPHGAATPLPRGGIQPRTLRTHGRPSMKRPGDPPVTALINRTAHQKPRPGRQDPLRLPANADTTHGPRISNVLSYRYATSPESSQTEYSTTIVAAQQGYWRSDGARTLRIPIPLRMWSATTAPDGDSPAFPLVTAYVEPPAGIEPATPSLPWIGGPPPC